MFLFFRLCFMECLGFIHFWLDFMRKFGLDIMDHKENSRRKLITGYTLRNVPKIAPLPPPSPDYDLAQFPQFSIIRAFLLNNDRINLHGRADYQHYRHLYQYNCPKNWVKELKVDEPVKELKANRVHFETKERLIRLKKSGGIEMSTVYERKRRR